MALNKILVLLILIVSSTAFAQERFLKVCNDPLPMGYEYENDIRWLKYHFKTDDCNKIASEISKLTSFNQFMVPEFPDPLLPFNWSRDFSYLSGLTSNMALEMLPWRKLGFLPDRKNVFQHPQLYSEFENLSVLDLSKPFTFNSVFKDLCNINKILPHIKTVILGSTDLYIMEKDCADYSKLPWIIATDSNGKNLTKLHSRIIGFMDFSGSVKNLIKFRYLRYLGINNATPDNDMKFLSKNINLTHLSMNIKTDVQNLSAIRELRNLRFLSLHCIKEMSSNNDQIEHLIPCDNSFVKDISFLSELPWLENLDLVANNLEDVSVVSKIKRLKYLNLSYNNITTLPDLSNLKLLKEVDFSHNPVAP